MPGITPLPAWLAPLLLPQELRALDHVAIDTLGIPGIELMERAGAALARAALRVLPDGPIVVACGSGNNGGDGLIAARVLRDAGREVRVLLTRDAERLHGDAALALERLGPMAVLGASEIDAALTTSTGVVDAMLGTGACGAPTGAIADVLHALRRAQLPTVACDVPSGVDAATGEVAGIAVQATATVTFHRPSPGHLIHPGKRYVGVLDVVDIGLPHDAATAAQHGVIRDAALRALPRRGPASHKYAAGAVLVVAGSRRYPGAALLAVRGAQRAGAGYVTAVVQEAAARLVLAHSPEVVVAPWPPDDASGAQRSALFEHRADALVVGPGVDGADAEQVVRAALAAHVPAVLDAGGLTPFAEHPEQLRRDAPLILTPHAGELARLLGVSGEVVAAQRLRSAQEAARRTGAIVVLKGDDTVIAAPNGQVVVNDLPAPALATAGSGDVLAGAIGALLAAGAAPLLAASAAVRLHAHAGRLAAAHIGANDGVVAWDVAEHLPAARRA